MSVKRLVLISNFAALLAIATWISIPVYEVAFTLQTLMVILIGLILGPVDALLATLVYLAVGSIGAPVFSGFKGGFDKLLGPTGGFLWSFPLTALGISLFKSKDKKWFIDIPVILGFGFLLTYLIGIPFIMTALDWDLAFAITWFGPYYIWDIAKIAVAYIVYRYLPRQIYEIIDFKK